MVCLFGYCGLPSPGLIEKMAGTLQHRCKDGYATEQVTVREDFCIEIGHGGSSWAGESHLAANPARKTIFGYAGVIFNMARLICNAGLDVVMLLESLGQSPEQKLTSLDGAFVAAYGCGEDFFLLRDAAGVKAIYWTTLPDRLLFASEIKALFADPAVPRNMRLGALPEYLTFSFIPGQRTMFENIEELQPGTILQYRHGQAITRRYFTFEEREWDGKDGGTEQDYAHNLRAVLEKAVDDCCRASRHTPAIFLSGGVDSSSVLALTARRLAGTPVKTFSAHFGSRYANENNFVNLMVERYHTAHTWLEICPARFMKQMRRIIWCLDDPIGDPITVPNFLLAEAAAQVTNLVLNGEGGDPCFGGPKNIPMMLASLYGPSPGRAEANWLECAYLFSFRKYFSELAQILRPDVLRQTGGEEALMSIITPFVRAAKPQSFLNKLMAMNIRLKGANLILVKVDKMTSANGILALPPLFAREVIEASMACPPQWKLCGNIEKHILKRAVEDIVPTPIIQRRKSGMMVPVRFWFRGEMKRYASQMLSKRNLERLGFFNIPYVLDLLHYDNADSHSSHYGLKLWMLITFLLWHEQMIEKSPVSRVNQSSDNKTGRLYVSK